MARNIKGAVVVVTGASSGIGRATALAFAARGARVVVAARRGDALDEVARACGALGWDALPVPTDVTDPASVARLADRALAAFGRIDVWVNNAGTGVFGAFADADLALHRRTIEVNLLGTMHGAYAVWPVFKRQGRGVLINMISMGGFAPTPFAAAYTASKFGLRGFNASLRQELAPHEDIHVCGIYPAMVDTPGFAHGANVSGRHLDPGPLLYTAEDVAAAVVRVARRPQADVAVGWPARAAQVAYNLAPRATEIAMGAAFRRLVARAAPAPRSDGALYAPVPEGRTTDGGWLARKRLPSAGRLSAGVAVAALGGLALAVGLAGARRRGRV
jgi:short-subunit dehydrogenase